MEKKFVFRNLVNNIKNMFGYDNSKTIQQKGMYSLGTSAISNISKSLSVQELLVLGDFIRCVEIIANDFAKIDIIHQKKKTKGQHFERKPNSIYEILLNDIPNDEISSFELKKIIVWNIFLYGYAAIYVERDEKENPISLIPVYSNFITRKVVNGIPEYEVAFSNQTTNSKNEPIKNKKSKEVVKFKNEDIIWITWNNIDNIQNVEFRNIYTSTLNKLKQNDLSVLNAFQNDIGASLFIKMNGATNDEQRQNVARALSDSFQYYKKTGILAFLFDDKLEVQSNNNFTQSPISLDMRKMIASEMSMKFGIPPTFLGIESTNQSTKQLTQLYLDKGLEPLVKNIISKLSYHFFKNKNERLIYTKFQISGLDLQETINTLSQAINNGIISINEAREIIGYQAVEGCDGLKINSALYDVETLEKTQENNLSNNEKNI